MKISCAVIGDLLPLYADNICSEESAELVDEHISECSVCKSKLEAMTEEIPPEKYSDKNLKPKNPFKKIRSRYVRLVVITLCLCAAILIPCIICTVLTINENTEQGASWSTVEMNGDLRKLGGKFKQGRCEEALDMMSFPYGSTYSGEELDYFISCYIEDFEDYFSKHKIKKIRVDSEQTLDGNVFGTLKLELNREDDSKKTVPELIMCFKYDSCRKLELESSMLVFRYPFDKSGGFDYPLADSDIPDVEDYKRYYSFPALGLVPSDRAEFYFKSLNDIDSIDHFTTIAYDETENYFKSLKSNENLEKLKEKYEDIPKKFASDYCFIDADTREITYVRDDEMTIHPAVSRYYMFSVDLKYLCGGEIVTVSCDVPFEEYGLGPARLTAVSNVSYSDNTPDEFKQRFEEIFC